MAFTQPTYRITCEGGATFVSGKAINVFHVTAGTGGTWSDTTLAGVLADIKILYTAAAPYVMSTWSIGSRVLEFLPGSTVPIIRNVAALSQTSSASVLQAPQLAAVMSWRTALAGPAYRGRTFFGPLGSAAVSNGALAGAFTSAMNAAGTSMLNTIAARGAGAGLVVRSLAHQVDNLVTSCTMNSKIDTLRKRG